MRLKISTICGLQLCNRRLQLRHARFIIPHFRILKSRRGYDNINVTLRYKRSLPVKKLVCILLFFCLCACASAETLGAYLPLYQSPAAHRGGETVSTSMPEEAVPYIAAQLTQAGSFSLGIGRTFLYLQQGMLICEHTAQNAGDYCVISCRTQDDMGHPVFEFLFEQFSKDGVKTLSAVYAYANGMWTPTILP